MNPSLSDTLPSAKFQEPSGVDSASPGTVRSARGGAAESSPAAPRRAPYTLIDGLNLLSGAIKVARTIGPVVTLARLAGLRNPLAWVGLTRRRGPLATLSLFGAGLAAGAGAGLLLAPRSGSELRRALVDGWSTGDAPPQTASDTTAARGRRVAPWVSASTVSIEDAPRHVHAVDVDAATARDVSAPHAQPAVSPPDHEHAVVDGEAGKPARASGAAGYRFG
jgi:hypothetical protein